MRVTLYTKPGCTLCDDVLRDLNELRADGEFDLQVRNILEEDGLARYHLLIPVVEIEGGEVLLPPLDWYRLSQALLAARSAAHGTHTR